MSDQEGESFERAVDVFGELCDLPPEEQRARLAALAEEDATLAQLVADLIRDDREADNRIDEGALAHLPSGAVAGLEGEADEFTSKAMKRLDDYQGSFSRYEIKGEVARGGQGVVLRIRDDLLDRDLAMKVILGRGDPEPMGKTPLAETKTLGRFLEEAQVTGQLDHPGIVPIHDLGLDSAGRAYFTMKLVKGKTLMEVFDELAEGKGVWTQSRVLGVLLKVCDAVRYAHAKGIIHRDLKPSNIMVGSFGEVFVMDWGLAKTLDRRDEKNIALRPEPASSVSGIQPERDDAPGQRMTPPLCTMEGDVLGTPAYMPPEQAAGRVASMAPHSDVYSLGAMLYHLIAGHMPYVALGEHLSNHAVLARVQTAAPRRLAEIAPQVHAELVAICEKAMAREPSNRYEGMSALADDLSAYVEGRVVGAYETGAWAEARKWVRRNKALSVSMATVVLAILAGGIAFAVKADEATSAAALAELNEADATLQRGIAEAETAKVLRLSDMERLKELRMTADELWPAHPEVIPAMTSWMDRARALVARLPIHRETLAEMRALALPWEEDQKRRDREEHPLASGLKQKASEFKALIARLEQGLDGEDMIFVEERLALLEAELKEPTEEVRSRQTWRFETSADQWQHNLLTTLIAGLEDLASGQLSEDVITMELGWCLPKRLAFARRLEAGFTSGGEFAVLWDRHLPDILATYPTLNLGPQMGLVPIGPDPESGLWEFAHLMTGEPAARDAGGTLVHTEETGLVLVLLPAGTFWMGATSNPDTAHNFDLEATVDERPEHHVTLSAFFLSKFEMTHGQWLRLTGASPSRWTASSIYGDWRPGPHAVEQVSWYECHQRMAQMDLSLPSEAQWEYGCRAGTTTPRPFSFEEFPAHANTADQAFDRLFAHGGLMPEPWDDGMAGPAVVGSLEPNAFGLHDMLGNLWEWCLDGYERYGVDPATDPLGPDHAAERVIRGGCFYHTAFAARSASRVDYSPSGVDSNTGVRPARAIDP
jgi:formylglycine-generating enzyme required for sulfatase activity/serine/threonine protein kinase